MIRNVNRTDLTWMIERAADEGWNPGLEDADAFYDADPEGFFLSERDGTPAACISVVNHSDKSAFLGFYICRPDLRGQGIGFALWRHALRHAGGRTIGLDGVPDQQENYARSGFVRTGATLRLEGPRAGLGVPAPASEVAELSPDIAAMDRVASGIERNRFLGAWVIARDTRRTVHGKAADGTPTLATARLCRSGCKIGPVIAPDAPSACAIAAAAADAIGADRVILDVPASAAALRSALEAAGFVATFSTARMYRGSGPAGDGRMMAVATLELG